MDNVVRAVTRLLGELEIDLEIGRQLAVGSFSQASQQRVNWNDPDSIAQSGALHAGACFCGKVTTAGKANVQQWRRLECSAICIG